MNQSNKIKDPNKKANATDNASQPNASCPSSCTITSRTVMAKPPISSARTRIGAGEEVDIVVSPGPAKWTVIPNDLIARIDEGPDIASFMRIQALDKAGKVTLKATTATCECSITFTIVLPEKCYMKPVPDTPIIHIQGLPSCGWFGRFYVLPNDVNFYNVYIRELNDKFIGTGYFATAQVNGKYHGRYTSSPDNASNWFQLDTYDPNNGSFNGGSADRIYTIHKGVRNPFPFIPFMAGTLTTPIRFQWTVNESGNKQHDFPPFMQQAIVDRNGRCTISKGGHSETSEVDDPTTGYNLETGKPDPTIK